jgi:hypothetical protein
MTLSGPPGSLSRKRRPRRPYVIARTDGTVSKKAKMFGSASAEVDDDDSRSIHTIILHELERVEEEDEVQMVQQEEAQEARGTR